MRLVKLDFLNLSLIINSIIFSIPSAGDTIIISAHQYNEGGMVAIPESDSVNIDFTGFAINETGSDKPDKLVVHV